MKKIFLVAALGLSLLSCKKEPVSETAAKTGYTLRVAAVDNDGTKTYTPVSRVKSGKVAVEFETADAANLKEFWVEVAADGEEFRAVKTIAVDLKNPNKIYSDTVTLN